MIVQNLLFNHSGFSHYFSSFLATFSNVFYNTPGLGRPTIPPIQVPINQSFKLQELLHLTTIKEKIPMEKAQERRNPKTIV
uniref:Ovule protein n=1 Tax=Romanomermis culicivorax TaxID=13658 RepID=A0A915JVQ7_ROMCU